MVLCGMMFHPLHQHWGGCVKPVFWRAQWPLLPSDLWRSLALTNSYLSVVWTSLQQHLLEIQRLSFHPRPLQQKFWVGAQQPTRGFWHTLMFEDPYFCGTLGKKPPPLLFGWETPAQTLALLLRETYIASESVGNRTQIFDSQFMEPLQLSTIANIGFSVGLLRFGLFLTLRDQWVLSVFMLFKSMFSADQPEQTLF